MSIELISGQWYRTRGGKIVYCIGVKPHGIYAQYPALVCVSDGSTVAHKIDGTYSTAINKHELDIVSHLPGCTGFDWVEPKKLQLREGAWYRRNDGRIDGPCRVHCKEPWIDDIKWEVGAFLYRDDGKSQTHSFWIVEEVPPPQPKYRPFANAAEYAPHFRRSLKRANARFPDAEGEFLIAAFSEKGVWILSGEFETYADMLTDKYAFADDGSPFGVPE